jgi:hypothetical protein
VKLVEMMKQNNEGSCSTSYIPSLSPPRIVTILLLPHQTPLWSDMFGRTEISLSTRTLIRTAFRVFLQDVRRFETLGSDSFHARIVSLGLNRCSGVYANIEVAWAYKRCFGNQ